MRHEEYLSQLIHGFAGDPGRGGFPERTGSTRADAVARWVAGYIAYHAQVDCEFEPPGPTSGSVDITDARTWARWTTHDREDVDMTLSGYRLERGQLRYHRHRIKIIADSVGNQRVFLRIHDWSMRWATDVEGRIRKNGGRWIVVDRSHPLGWPEAPRRPAPPPPRAVLQPCCRATLRRIAQIDSRFSNFADAADRIQSFDEWTSNPFDPTSNSNSQGGLWDHLGTVKRNQIRELIRLELGNHDDGANDPLHRHWDMMRRAL